MKILFKIVLILYWVTLPVFAQVIFENQQSGTPTVFKVKPTDMKLCEDFDLSTGECSGDNVFTFLKTMTADNGRCDIAGVTENSIACNYGPTSNIPLNVTYNYSRITLDRTMWLKGTVTNVTKQFTSSDSCHTNSANTQANGSIASEGSLTGSPSTQAIKFTNGPGNEDFLGNGSKSSANTIDTYGNTCYNDSSNQGCAWGSVTTLDTYGSTVFDGTNPHPASDYSFTANYTTPPGGVWQSGLSTNDETLVIIYKLTTPFTRTNSDIAPLITMSFDVTDALDAQFIYANEAGSDPIEACSIYIGNPGVSITISE